MAEIDVNPRSVHRGQMQQGYVRFIQQRTCQTKIQPRKQRFHIALPGKCRIRFFRVDLHCRRSPGGNDRRYIPDQSGQAFAEDPAQGYERKHQTFFCKVAHIEVLPGKRAANDFVSLSASRS